MPIEIEEKWSFVHEEMVPVRATNALTPLFGSLEDLKTGVVFNMKGRNYFLRIICGEGYEEDVNKPTEVEFRYAMPHEDVTPLKTWDYVKESIDWCERTKADEATCLDAAEGIHLIDHKGDFEIMGEGTDDWADNYRPDDAEHILSVEIPRFNRDSTLEIYAIFNNDEPHRVYLFEDLVWHKKAYFWPFNQT